MCDASAICWEFLSVRTCDVAAVKVVEDLFELLVGIEWAMHVETGEIDIVSDGPVKGGVGLIGSETPKFSVRAWGLEMLWVAA